MLPHSFVFGHLISLGMIMAKYPPDTYGHLVPELVKENYPELCSQGILYVDVWPVSHAAIFVWNADMLVQLTQTQGLPKGARVAEFTHPLTEGKDLVAIDGPEWKIWRTVFNPGFSVQNLLRLVPAMVEEVEVFKSRLAEAAKTGSEVQLIELANEVTLDVIGRAALGARLHAQTAESPLIEVFREQISLLIYELIALKHLDLKRPYKIWRNRARLRAALLPYIYQAIAEAESGQSDGSKTILTLAVQSYRADVASNGDRSLIGPSGEIDPAFLEAVLPHLKVFLFAGHDTTASTVAFAYYLLSSYPETLRKLRAEHDAVLGTDASQATTLISSDPSLLNKLPYTSAVIKETLRLYTPINSVRQGTPGYLLVHPDTKKNYPTDGWYVMSSTITTHFDEEYFPRAHDFVPERFLVRDESDPLYVRKNLWRAFELGPRNCIGQELATLEIRTILAATAREFDVTPTYAEDAPTVFGQRGYQALVHMSATAHPKGGMPVCISFNS
jgi:cytochrome P450